MICNVVLVSGVQQSESVTHIHIFTLFFLFFNPLFSRFFPHIGHYRVLSRVPYARQYALIRLSILFLKFIFTYLLKFWPDLAECGILVP